MSLARPAGPPQHLHASRRAIFTDFDLPDVRPKYNVSATQEIAVVWPKSDSRRELAAVRWGLILSWADKSDHREDMRPESAHSSV